MEFLMRLLNTHSPSGNEAQIVDVLHKEMSNYCRTQTDSIGNFYMYTGLDSELKVMLTAHSDEVGFQIIYIDNKGYVYVRAVASVDPQTIPGSTVVALSDGGEIYGVVGKKSPHVLNGKDKERIPNACDMWIDFGFKSEHEAKKYIKCGDFVTLCSNAKVSCNGQKIISKGLDNKVGVYILTEVIKAISKKNLPMQVVGVATAQEELGCRGAFIAANRIKPDVAFCLDVGIATDIPNMNEKQYGIFELGRGMGIVNNPNNNSLLVDSLLATANKFDIPVQKIIGHKPSGGTEASLIQLTNNGVATANISIPSRYMHSWVEMCDLQDIANAINLLIAEIEELTSYSKEDFCLYHKR